MNKIIKCHYPKDGNDNYPWEQSYKVCVQQSQNGQEPPPPPPVCTFSIKITPLPPGRTLLDFTLHSKSYMIFRSSISDFTLCFG